MIVAEGEPEIGDWYECFIDEIERFFNVAFSAGAIAEREACAKVCEPVEGSAYEVGVYKTMQTLAAAIRARSEQ